MFKALVLVCFVSQNCVELHDNRGLYKTEVECKARISEMISDFVSDKSTPPVVTIHFQCQTNKGTNT